MVRPHKTGSGGLYRDRVTLTDDMIALVQIDQVRFEPLQLPFIQNGVGADDHPITG